MQQEEERNILRFYYLDSMCRTITDGLDKFDALPPPINVPVSSILLYLFFSLQSFALEKGYIFLYILVYKYSGNSGMLGLGYGYFNFLTSEVEVEAEVKIEVRSIQVLSRYTSIQNFSLLALKITELCLFKIFDFRSRGRG